MAGSGGKPPNTPEKHYLAQIGVHNISEEKRTKSIKIRVTLNELEALRDRCPQNSLAPWLRDLGLGKRKLRRIPRADPALLRQLAGAGNLLNQIARKLNNGQWNTRDRIEVLTALMKIEKYLQEIDRNAG